MKISLIALVSSAAAFLAAITVAVIAGYPLLAAALALPAAEVTAQLAMIIRVSESARSMGVRMSPGTLNRLLSVSTDGRKFVVLKQFKAEYALVEDLNFVQAMIDLNREHLERAYQDYELVLQRGFTGWMLQQRQQMHSADIADAKLRLTASQQEYTTLLAS